MRIYDISFKQSGKYSAVIYPVSYENPVVEIVSISKDLRDRIPKDTYVLFDLLLSNGDSFNRFVEAFFDGEYVDSSSFSITQISQEQVKSLNKYYCGKTEQLNRSVLSTKEKYLFATSKE
jgi:hypothetical protein